MLETSDLEAERFGHFKFEEAVWMYGKIGTAKTDLNTGVEEHIWSRWCIRVKVRVGDEA